jgi:hypothetical protein
MASVLMNDVLDDDVAVTLANIVAAANRRARELGVNIEESLISVSQSSGDDEGTWEINYGPRDYVSRRGGDTVIEIDSSTQVRRVRRGQ